MRSFALSYGPSSFHPPTNIGAREFNAGKRLGEASSQEMAKSGCTRLESQGKGQRLVCKCEDVQVTLQAQKE